LVDDRTSQGVHFPSPESETSVVNSDTVKILLQLQKKVTSLIPCTVFSLYLPSNLAGVLCDLFIPSTSLTHNMAMRFSYAVKASILFWLSSCVVMFVLFGSLSSVLLSAFTWNGSPYHCRSPSGDKFVMQGAKLPGMSPTYPIASFSHLHKPKLSGA